MDKDFKEGMKKAVATNRKILGLPPQAKTKEEFSEMLQLEFYHNKKCADDLANIVAGYGAFNPVLHDAEAMTVLEKIKSLGYSPEQVRSALEAINEN